MGYHSRINNAFLYAPRIPLTEASKFVLMSDCHRGTGTSNDNFLKNQNLYFAALKHYYQTGHTYIELGDGDELWENRSLCQIIDIHSNVFWLMSEYFRQNRLYLLFGNHDIDKKNTAYTSQHLSTYHCSNRPEHSPLFADIHILEGIILEDSLHKKDIYLTHGHQADVLNSRLWKISRFLVRYMWKPLEHFGVLDPTSAAKNNTHKHRTEKRLTNWAAENQHLLITGHTHRPMLGTPASPYFNTGSCVHPRCVTCIEIEHRCMTLVKWATKTKTDMTLYVAREVLAGPVCIDDYETLTTS